MNDGNFDAYRLVFLSLYLICALQLFTSQCLAVSAAAGDGDAGIITGLLLLLLLMLMTMMMLRAYHSQHQFARYLIVADSLRASSAF